MDSNSNKHIIDLLDSDPEDDDLLNDAKPVFKKRKPSPDSVTAVNFFSNTTPPSSNSSVALVNLPSSNSSVVVLNPPLVASATTPLVRNNASTTPQNPASSNKAVEVTDCKPSAKKHTNYLGSFFSSIVGFKQSNTISFGDVVVLVPDRANIQNGIRVLSVPNGTLLGHLQRDHSAVLMPYLHLQNRRTLQLHVTVCSGNADASKVPLQVICYATPSVSKVDCITLSISLGESFASSGWKNSLSSELTSCKYEEKLSIQDIQQHSSSENLPLSDQHESGSLHHSIEESIPANIDLSCMDWEQQQEELDEMFEMIQQEQLENLPNIPMPKQFESMDLYDYQKDGIRWLYKQEREADVPPFFERKDNGSWFCTISRCIMRQRPPVLKGGILADDMGLGKTLQTLGLILSSPPPPLKSYPYKRSSSSLANTSPRCTLIICPVSVMANWQIQIKKHVNGYVKNKVLSLAVYHGPGRENRISMVRFNQIDILITSYNTLAYDLRKLEHENENDKRKTKQNKKKSLSIFDVKFHRVVLDEAHIIRSSSTGFFKATARLQTNHKLCLTGTPFINKPEDIHSLLAFLEVSPLNNRMVFDRTITKRIKARDECGLATLRNTMKYVSLRRTKEQCKTAINLVEKVVETRLIEMTEGVHKTTHDVLYEATRNVFLGFLKQNAHDGVLENYMAFLAMVLRCRQSCCHAGLIPAEQRQAAADVLDFVQKVNKEMDLSMAEDLLARLRGQLEAEKLEECAVCFNELEKDSTMILRECKHIFCEACLSQLNNPVCPICRNHIYGPDDILSMKEVEEATKTDTDNSGRKHKDKSIRAVKSAQKLGRSPKITALLEAIEEMAEDEKGVIFSQWTSFLDILEIELAKEGYTFTRIDGTMSAGLRLEAMERFDTEGTQTNSTPRFILCSLMACGTGINLTRGNWCFLMDSWWNAAAENQAMDRVHRIGQKRPVKVIRFLIEDSIETRMMALQEAKSALGKGSLEKLKPEEKRKARITTLHDLFNVRDINELWDG